MYRMKKTAQPATRVAPEAATAAAPGRRIQVRRSGVHGKPIQRLWLQSMTPQAIRDAFGELRSDEQMRGLALSLIHI